MQASRTLRLLLASILALCLVAACQIPATGSPPLATQAVATAASATLTPPAIAPAALTPTSIPSAAPGPALTSPTPAPAAPSATETPTPGSRQELPVFGVAVRGETNDPAVQKLLSQAGVRWVRTSINWASVETAPGVYKWDSLDAHILTLASIGVVPVIYITDNPTWAATSSCGPIDKIPLSQFGRFVTALAGRYNGATIAGGRALPTINYWQFYNEPDNRWLSGEASGFGGCWGRAGAQYAQMLAAAWTAVHTANPRGQVVFGGIAGESVDCPTSWECSGQPIFNFNIDGSDFVDDVLDYMQSHPGPDYFDVFDFHYYPAFHTRWDGYDPGLRGKAEYYRQRLAGWGIERPMMCSEAGRRSDPGQVIDGVPGSDDEQSRYVVRLFAQGMSSGLLNVLWFTLADIVEPKQSGAAAWGLLTQSLQPKPSYSAYRTLSRELSGLRYKGPATFKGDIEAYVFAAGNRETTVLWARAGSVPASFRGSQVTVVGLHGEETTVLDGGNGDADRRADGVVTITATQNPVFVRRQP